MKIGKFLDYFFFICVALVLLAGCQPRESNIPEWRLVYQHDFSGKAIYGHVDTLISAMKRGSPIRVSWGGTEANGTRWIEFAEPDFTTIMNDTAVVVQFPLSMIQTHYTDADKAFLKTNPPVGWRALMSTTGKYHQFHYDITTGKLLRTMYARTSVAWFALSTGAVHHQNLVPRDAFKVDSVAQFN